MAIVIFIVAMIFLVTLVFWAADWKTACETKWEKIGPGLWKRIHGPVPTDHRKSMEKDAPICIHEQYTTKYILRIMFLTKHNLQNIF